MERWSGKVAVVTGASSGIGAATALALADAGMQVVAVARRVERIEALARQVRGAGALEARRCDVAREADVRRLFREVVAARGGVDVLVNNAGVLSNAPFTICTGAEAVALEAVDQVLAVNVRAPVLCTQLAVESMCARGVPGHVVCVNSIAGHYVPQGDQQLSLHAYPASKHALTALVECLRREFSSVQAPIRITSVSPGAVDTEMIRKTELPLDIPLLKAADVADAILYALAAPQHVNIQEIMIHPTGERF